MHDHAVHCPQSQTPSPACTCCRRPCTLVLVLALLVALTLGLVLGTHVAGPVGLSLLHSAAQPQSLPAHTPATSSASSAQQARQQTQQQAEARQPAAPALDQAQSVGQAADRSSAGTNPLAALLADFARGPSTPNPLQLAAVAQDWTKLPHVRRVLVDGTNDPAGPQPVLPLLQDVSTQPQAVQRVLGKLLQAPTVSRQALDQLLQTVPGVSLSQLAASTSRTALLVFTQPDCVHCRAAEQLLRALHGQLHFPVLFVPIGQERSSLAFYTRPGARLDGHEQEQVAAWLARATTFLTQTCQTTTPFVPTYCWVLDNEVRQSTLNRTELTVLLGLLSVRAQALDRAPGLAK